MLLTSFKQLVDSTSRRCPSVITFLLPEVPYRACDTQLSDFYSLHLREVSYNVLNGSTVIDSCHLFLKCSQQGKRRFRKVNSIQINLGQGVKPKVG